MKADERENRVRLVKYGLPASEVLAFEARYAVVMQERQAIGNAAAHANLRRAATFLAALGAGETMPDETVNDAVAPEPLNIPTLPDAEPAKAVGLRAALGLS